MEREGKLAILHSPQIALDDWSDLNRQADARLGRAVGQHLRHLGQAHEIVQDRGRILGTEEDVEIADRLGPAAQAAADLRPDHPGMADRLEDGGDQAQGLVLEDAPAGLLQESDPSRILASVFAPNPFCLAISPASPAARRSARLSIFSASCSALIFLGPRPGTLRGPSSGGMPRAARHTPASAGRRELDDLGVHRLADPGHLRQPAVGDHLRQVVGQIRERLRRVVIGPAAKRVFPLDSSIVPISSRIWAMRAVSMSNLTMRNDAARPYVK